MVGHSQSSTLNGRWDCGSISPLHSEWRRAIRALPLRSTRRGQWSTSRPPESAKRTAAFGGATAPKIRVLRQRGQAAQSEYGQSTVTAQRMDSVSTLGISAAAAPGRAGGGRRRGAAVSLARCQCGGRRGAAGRAEHCSFWAPLRLIVGRWPSRWPSVRGSAQSPPKWPEEEAAAAVLAVAASVCSALCWRRRAVRSSQGMAAGRSLECGAQTVSALIGRTVSGALR